MIVANEVLEESQNLCVGQGLDLYWRHHVRCPSIQEYIAMVDNKTGSFFRLASRLMEAEATKPSSSAKLLNLVTLMGRYYQIRDDYQNLASQEVRMKQAVFHSFWVVFAYHFLWLFSTLLKRASAMTSRRANSLFLSSISCNMLRR